jgi:hypothetical protein
MRSQAEPGNEGQIQTFVFSNFSFAFVLTAPDNAQHLIRYAIALHLEESVYAGIRNSNDPFLAPREFTVHFSPVKENAHATYPPATISTPA